MADVGPSCDLTVDADGACLRLAGPWRGTRLPDTDAIVERLRAVPPRRLTVAADAVADWDSRLPAFLLACHEACRGAGGSLDSTSLPDGLAALLRLATATAPAASSRASRHGLFSAAALRQQLHEIGEEVLDSLAFLGDALRACGRTFVPGSATRWVDLRDCLYQAGPDALPIITLTSVLVGMILAYLGAVQLQQFGAEVYVADLVAIGMLREMGALMTAVVMAGRTGAAYAAQLGTMQGNEEVDAIATLGLSPMEFLVAPRMLALVVTMPLLVVYADLLGIIGGGIVAGGMGISALQYLSQLEDAFSFTHAFVGIGKGVLFAFLIALAGSRAGMSAGRNAAAVGRATTEAVVTAVVYLIVADAGMNILFQQLGI
ncbi:MlaE family ABC transporter permease [Pseudohaliea rubra]|uniref:Permease component of ABC-type transport system n=1 Tax=Pseudohaliea rubra DSM 19751 TaxID=1265313 RepID=A0A095VV07_9GAMM|nr:ABC transporter permease [Pseudohaliea rubra]KGE05297.1 Permease component of ABC-type transport system [Pseudohaliea rubra DSM 19751]